MPISFKSILSSAVANATFMDKTVDDTTIGKVTLANTDTVSGSSIGNAQRTINRNSSFVYSEVSKTASGTVTLDELVTTQEHHLVGDGGAVTLSVLPFTGTQSCENGTVIYLIGGDDVNTVKINDNRIADFGCVLNGSATLGLYDMLILKFNLEKKRYIEIGRNF